MKMTSQLMFSLITSAVTVGCTPNDDAPVTHEHVAFHVSPVGQGIVFSAADANLYLLNLKTSEIRQLTKTDTIERMPSFAPDGARIVYMAREKGAHASFLFALSLDDRQARQLTDTADVYDYGPSFSADGKRIAFARAHLRRPYSLGGSTWDLWDVYVMNTDGTEQRRVTRENYNSISRPVFSHDGKTILYSAYRDHETTIFEVAERGNTAPAILTTGNPKNRRHGAWASRPAVSPDGKQVSFISDRIEPFHYDVFVMNRDGTHPTPLGVTTNSRYNSSPVFMPDRKRVLFLEDAASKLGVRGPIFRLCQVDTDGKNWRQIADSDLFTNPMSWKPKPK